jgi:hypothetical protein
VSPAGARNLFQFAEIPVKPGSIITVPVTERTPGPRLDSSSSGLAPSVETPPFTFYGYVSRPARPLRGFFSDGSRIYIKAEGELIAGRFKVIHIDAAAAVIDDTAANKRHTLALDES